MDLKVGDKVDLIVVRKAGIGFTVLVEEERSEKRRLAKECRSRWSPYH